MLMVVLPPLSYDKNEKSGAGSQPLFAELPVGSEEATKWYVEQVLEAGCAFVNCIPVFIAREQYWRQRFEKKGLPLIGDDIRQF